MVVWASSLFTAPPTPFHLLFALSILMLLVSLFFSNVNLLAISLFQFYYKASFPLSYFRCSYEVLSSIRHFLPLRGALASTAEILTLHPGVYVAVVQSPSHVWLFVTPWTAARQATLSLTPPGVCPSSCPLNRWCHPPIFIRSYL